MTAQAVQNPLPTFTGLDGLPLSGGSVYFGVENGDPIASPVTVYFDAAMTVEARQPLTTNAGFVMRNGAPASLFASSAFSMLVKDSKQRQVFYTPSVPAFSAANMSFQQAGAGAVTRSAQDKMRDLVSVFDWFTPAQIADWRSGTASLDVTSAITTALSESTHGIRLEDGAGLITSLTVPTGKAMVGTGSKRCTLKQKAGTSGTAVIVNSTSQACTVGGFQIDGNKANQSVANKGFALVSAGSPPGGTHFPGGNHRFYDIYAVDCKGRGIDLDGPGGVLSVGRLWTYRCDAEGVYINVQDSMFEEIDAGDSGLHGVYFGSGAYNNRVGKLKAWFSGQIDSAASGDGLFCAGWYNQVGVVELQDCGRHGLNLSAASNNIFPAVHIESAGRVSASAYGLVLSDSRSNVIVSNHKNRTNNAGYLACMHMVAGGTGVAYNDIVIVKGDAALPDYVFDDATFQPARNFVRVANLTNDDGFNVVSRLVFKYQVKLEGAGGTAQFVVDTGASAAATKWRVTPNGNDSVILGYSNSGTIYFSGSHGGNPGWRTELFGGGAANAKWRLQNANGTDIQTVIEAGESGGTRTLAFFGAGAVARQAVPAAATDPTTTQDLANALRTALVNLGLAA